MKRLLTAGAKVLIVIAVALATYAVLNGVYLGTNKVIEAIKLYIDVAIANPIESIIYYCVLAIILFLEDLVFHRKPKNKEQ